MSSGRMSSYRMSSLRVFVPFVGVFLFIPSLFAAGADATVTGASRHDTSAPFRDLAGQAPDNAAEHHERLLLTGRPGPEITSRQPDPVAAQPAATLTGVSTVISFDGQKDNDTLALLGTKYVPPDTNGAAGARQYVQMVNVTVAVYDKASGTTLLGPALISSLWKGFGGPCETGNGGDPIVLYDQLAGRWLISQLQFNSDFSSDQECVAISTSSDATGSYHRYEFDFGAHLPDYPKYGVWPDAYYSSQNMFTPMGGTFAFDGARACALDRASMLAGKAANMICFQTGVASLLASSLDGSTLPPSGAPDYFANLRDSSNLNLFKFHVDFAAPANSTFIGPAVVPVAPFSEVCQGALVTACIPEPAPGERLDSLGDRLMFRLAYRNFGDHESLLATHTVTGGGFAGVRWYEIRRPGASPFVFQQGTVVDPVNSFWMGSIAMDKAGDIALGFSASSRSLDPSIFMVGRTAADPAGTMNGPDVLLFGTGVQTNSFNRWGDYSAMAVDPSDDCTFWYTQEYYRTTGSFNWSTRISAVRFDACKEHGR
jgi:hypothetical protein